MLVLTRKVDDTVVIDHETVVRVLGIEGERVRLGFEGPEEVAIWRGELEMGLCPECGGSEVESVGEDSFRCGAQGCRARWRGVRVLGVRA